MFCDKIKEICHKKIFFYDNNYKRMAIGCSYGLVYKHFLAFLSYIMHFSSRQGKKSVYVISLSAILLTPTGSV